MGAGLRQSGRGVNVLGTFLRVCREGQLRRGVAGVAVSALRQACVDSSSGNVGFGEGWQERDSLLWFSRQGLASSYMWSEGAPARAVDTARTPSGASILAGGLTTLPIFDHGQHHFLQEDIQINQLQNTSPRVWQPPFFSQRADLGGVL